MCGWSHWSYVNCDHMAKLQLLGVGWWFPSISQFDLSFYFLPFFFVWFCLMCIDHHISWFLSRTHAPSFDTNRPVIPWKLAKLPNDWIVSRALWLILDIDLNIDRFVYLYESLCNQMHSPPSGLTVTNPGPSLGSAHWVGSRPWLSNFRFIHVCSIWGFPAIHRGSSYK